MKINIWKITVQNVERILQTQSTDIANHILWVG
jgi:hypothetical protein